MIFLNDIILPSNQFKIGKQIPIVDYAWKQTPISIQVHLFIKCLLSTDNKNKLNELSNLNEQDHSRNWVAVNKTMVSKDCSLMLQALTLNMLE